MQRGAYDVGSIATLLRQTEANLAVLNRPLEEPRHLLPPAGAYPAASIAADLVAAAAAAPTLAPVAAAPTAAGIAGGAELEAQLGLLRAGVQGLEGRLEDELRAFLAICEKRFQAREEQLRGLAESAQAAAEAACQGASRRVDARLQELERSAQAHDERALHEVWESVRSLQADARAADARARRCALADDVADRIREVEQAGQHRLEERLAAFERRAAEHRAQLDSQCESWKEALGQRCGALEQRLWEQQGDRNDLLDSVLKRLPEAGPVRELREEVKARVYAEEVQLRRLSACEAKLSKMPALEAKVDFAASQISQQAEEQAEAVRTAVETTQRLSQKLLGLEASCQQTDVQAAALEARLQSVLDSGQSGAGRGAEALELRLQQRVQETEARAQRNTSRLEQSVAQQLASLSRRVDEEGRDAQQQLEVQLQEIEGAQQQELERLAAELRAEVAEKATNSAAVQQLEAQLVDIKATQQKHLEKLGELEGAQRQQASELRAEVSEKATDPGVLQQLETQQRDLKGAQQQQQDRMRELEGARQQQQDRMRDLEGAQQQQQDRMRDLEGAQQQHLERLALELRAEATGAQTAESRMHGVVSELVRVDQERRDRQIAGLPSRAEFDAVTARLGSFEARVADLQAASSHSRAELTGMQTASTRVADLAGGVQDLTSGIEDIRVQVAALEGRLEGSLARATGSEHRAENACAVVRRLELEVQSMKAQAGGVAEQLGGHTIEELLDTRDAEVLQRSSAALGDLWAELAELRAQLGSTDSHMQALRSARQTGQPSEPLVAARSLPPSPPKVLEPTPRNTVLEERLIRVQAQLDHLKDSCVPKLEGRVWGLEKPGLEARTACLERQVAVLEAEGRGVLPTRQGSSSEEGAPQSSSLSVSALTSRLNRLEEQMSNANLEGTSISQLPEPVHVVLRLRWPSDALGAPGSARVSEGELAAILKDIVPRTELVRLQRDAGQGGESPRGLTCWLTVDDARAAEAELRQQLRAEDSPLRRALPGLVAEDSSATMQQATLSPVTRDMASRLDDLERSRELFTSDLEHVEHRVLHVERLAFATPLGMEVLGHPTGVAGLPPAAGEPGPSAAHARAPVVHQPPRTAQAAADDSDEELDFDNEDSQETGPAWQRRQAEPRRPEPGSRAEGGPPPARPGGRRDTLADGRPPSAPTQGRVGERSPSEPAEAEGRPAPPAGQRERGVEPGSPPAEPEGRASSASQAQGRSSPAPLHERSSGGPSESSTPEAEGRASSQHSASQDEAVKPQRQASGDRSLSALIEEGERESPAVGASAGDEVARAPAAAEPRAPAMGIFQDQAAARSPVARPPAGRRRLSRGTGLPVVARASIASKDEEIQRAFAAMDFSGASALSWDDVRAYLGDHLGFGQADAARLFGLRDSGEASEVKGVVTLEQFRSRYAALNPYMILTRQDEVIVRKPGSINVQDISLDSLENCEVFICDLTAQADLNSCNGCLILIGPCRGLVSMQDCKDCVCWVAANEFRAKNCQGCTFHLYSRTEPAIEDSEDLVFAPWSASYPRCASQFERAGFDSSANRWNCVVDVGLRRGSPAAGACCWRVAALTEVVELTIELEEPPEIAAPPDGPGPAVTHQALIAAPPGGRPESIGQAVASILQTRPPLPPAPSAGEGPRAHRVLDQPLHGPASAARFLPPPRSAAAADQAAPPIAVEGNMLGSDSDEEDSDTSPRRAQPAAGAGNVASTPAPGARAAAATLGAGGAAASGSDDEDEDEDESPLVRQAGATVSSAMAGLYSDASRAVGRAAVPAPGVGGAAAGGSDDEDEDEDESPPVRQAGATVSSAMAGLYSDASRAVGRAAVPAPGVGGAAAGGSDDEDEDEDESPPVRQVGATVSSAMAGLYSDASRAVGRAAAPAPGAGSAAAGGSDDEAAPPIAVEGNMLGLDSDEEDSDTSPRRAQPAAGAGNASSTPAPGARAAAATLGAGGAAAGGSDDDDEDEDESPPVRQVGAMVSSAMAGLYSDSSRAVGRTRAEATSPGSSSGGLPTPSSGGSPSGLASQRARPPAPGRPGASAQVSAGASAAAQEEDDSDNDDAPLPQHRQASATTAAAMDGDSDDDDDPPVAQHGQVAGAAAASDEDSDFNDFDDDDALPL